MAKRILENLSWVVPSVAIVLAASGFFDRSGKSDEAAVAPVVVAEQPAAVVTAPPVAVVQEPVEVVAAAPTPVQETAVQETAVQPVAEVTRAPSLATALPNVGAAVDADRSSIITLQQNPTPAVVAAPAAPALETGKIDDPAAFFGAAQAAIARANSCVDDLRSLTKQARIHFPSGGLTGEAQGIEQARLIGLVAQDCPSVTIQVEGHSDPTGNPTINLRLSQERAEAVITRIAASGIDTSNFIAKGMGDVQPSGLTGPKGRAYYDRRVEFTVVENARNVSFTSNAAVGGWKPAACVAQLQSAVDQTKLFYAPRSIAVTGQDMQSAFQLATLAQNCPQARLRVVGQFSDQPGSGETAATARLRAVALMGTLVGAGIPSEQIIISSPSKSRSLPGQPGISNSRIDFDVILEES